MNKIDKEWYRYLKALSKIPRDDNFDKYCVNNIKGIKNYMEGTVWSELHKLGYVNSNLYTTQIVTEKGMEQLRIFEDMHRKDMTLIVSVIAITISIFAFIKSMGWI